MNPDTGVTGVAHAIQLSVAPVFLVSGIAGILVVMTNRLARVVDRLRSLQREMAPGAARQSEIRILQTRARWISQSIFLCTSTALLISTVIVVLFAGAFLGVDTSTAVALLFIAGMIAFVTGLVLFLREILLATAWLRNAAEPIGTASESPSRSSAL